MIGDHFKWFLARSVEQSVVLSVTTRSFNWSSKHHLNGPDPFMSVPDSHPSVSNTPLLRTKLRRVASTHSKQSRRYDGRHIPTNLLLLDDGENFWQVTISDVLVLKLMLLMSLLMNQCLLSSFRNHGGWMNRRIIVVCMRHSQFCSLRWNMPTTQLSCH